MRRIRGLGGWLLLPLLGWASLRAEAPVEQLLAWNEANLRAVELASPSPCLVARNFAIIQGAAFEAYNAIVPGYRGAFAELPAVEGELDPVLASLAAAWHASRTLFPSYRATYDALWDRQVAGWGQDENREASVRFGLLVADACLRERAGDGASSTITYLPRDEPGKWRRTPPRLRPPELPHWPLVRPFLLEQASQFRPPPPPALDSTEYAEAVEEVRALGVAREGAMASDATRTVAHFWSCFSYTATPSGHWNEIAAILIRQEALDYATAARWLAILNLVLADVGIAAWDSKYYYELWRPIHAIHRADEDGNPATVPDPTWDSELEAPPHPEYVSGHSAFSGAGARLLALLLGRTAVPFTVASPSVPGVELHYEDLDHCAEEIAMSRVYGGIHFRFSNQAGLEMGREIATWAFSRAYPPLDG
jgi:hypothetical protein